MKQTNVFLIRLSVLLLCVFILKQPAFTQEKKTYLYAVKDTNKLYMDVYYPEKQNDRKGCLFFIFGGGYIGGARDDKQIDSVKEHFTEKGYVVIGIDYRLGLKNADNFSIITGLKNFERAVRIAAEDFISALSFTLENFCTGDAPLINPACIIAMGSSAGAITALQADYAMCNGLYNAGELPDTFRLAGVVSYAGAVFSTKGQPKYKMREPAPTLFCHGTEDRLVIYKKMQLFNVGLFGSDFLARKFKKNNYGYQIRRYRSLGHQVAMMYPGELGIVDEFIDNIVFGNRKIQIDETFYDPSIKPMFLKFKIKDLESFKQAN